MVALAVVSLAAPGAMRGKIHAIPFAQEVALGVRNLQECGLLAFL